MLIEKTNICANSAGSTIIELIVVCSIIGIILGTAISNLKELDDPLSNASFSISHYMRLVRSRAISQTMAIQISPASTTRLSAATSDSCNGTMAATTALNLDLPSGTHLEATDWSVCFTPRGFALEHVQFDIADNDGQSKTVEVALGGGARVR